MTYKALGALLLLAATVPTGGAAYAANVGEGSAATTAVNAGQTTAVYRVYNHGLHVVDATADYKLTDWGYGIRTTIHAGGFLSMFLRMDIQSTAQVASIMTTFSRPGMRALAIPVASIATWC